MMTQALRESITQRHRRPLVPIFGVLGHCIEVLFRSIQSRKLASFAIRSDAVALC